MSEQRSTPQPLKGVLALERLTNRWLAEATGRSEAYVGRVANGLIEPSPGFRADVVRVLGAPEERLFRSSDRAEAGQNA